MADFHSNPPVSKAAAMQATSHSLLAYKALTHFRRSRSWMAFSGCESLLRSDKVKALLLARI